MKALALFTIALPTALLAQPILDQNTTVPAPGSVFNVNFSAFTAATAGGANAVWDFSTLAIGSSATVTAIDPIGSGLEGEFPTATVMTTNDLSQQAQVYQATNSFIDNLGVFSVSNQVLLKFTDGRRELVLPCTFGTEWTDSFSGDYFQGGNDLGDRTGNVAAEADGFGDLILPYATFTNVLRVHMLESNTDLTVAGNATVNGERYQYYKPGVSAPLLESVDFTIVNGQGTSVEQRIQWLAGITTDVEEALVAGIGVTAFPNPATDRVTITYGAAGPVQLDVFDATGRVVRSTRAQNAVGIHQYVIDTEDLQAGMHVVRVTDGKGHQGSVRIVVQ